MAGDVPFRALVEYAVGGGWGDEEPQANGLAVRVIRGTDFANIASGAFGAVPSRFENRKKAQKRLLRAGDIVLEISGGSRTSNQSTGRTLLITEEMLVRLGGSVIPASFCRLVRVRADTVAPQYAYYVLQEMYRSGRAALYEHQSTGISNFQFEYFLDEEVVRLPSLPEQRAIAHILGTLDDKIELNRRMSETLEAMARALFKSWFVDFEPVRAKCRGNLDGHPRWRRGVGANHDSPLQPGIPGTGGFPTRPYADLFPDRLVDSELGEIPEGWEVTTLLDVIEINPHRSLAKGDTAPYLDMASMPTRGHAPDAVVDRPFGSGTRFMNGDTLVARITPCLENGKTAFVDFLKEGQVGWGSTEFIVLRPKPPLPEEFAYCLARTKTFRDFAIQSMTGTSGRQRVQADSLTHFRLPRVPESVAVAFGRAIKPLFARSSAAVRESRTLAALRDALLPRLISGELRVKDAERFLKECGL